MKRSALLKPEQKELMKKFYHYLKGKRYSDQTIVIYGSMMVEFMLHYGEKNVEMICMKDIEKFSQDVIIGKKLSISYHRQFIGAFKLFARMLSLAFIDIDSLERPKKSKKLPIVLSKEEVIMVLRKTRNAKHKLALAFLYSAGLRVGELISLKIKDIDLNRRQIRIEMSKGRKDRYVMMPESLIQPYLSYLDAFEPKKYIIESKTGGKYSPSSIRNVLAASCKRAGISKHVTPHTLRHSYATHLLESGLDIRYIQELLGHSKTETTMIYTHIQRKDLVRIKSPLDLIIEEQLKDENDSLSGKLPNNF